MSAGSDIPWPGGEVFFFYQALYGKPVRFGNERFMSSLSDNPLIGLLSFSTPFCIIPPDFPVIERIFQNIFDGSRFKRISFCSADAQAV